VKFNYPLILAEGIVVGMITGIVGAGGGFLIIPALVLLAKLPMKQAVGTSLIIIAAKSLIGFTGDLKGGEVIDWNFLLRVLGDRHRGHHRRQHPEQTHPQRKTQTRLRMVRARHGHLHHRKELSNL
jgi:hypothetical protein